MTTDPERVKDIFLAAAELPDEAAQGVYLEQACGDDIALRERVEALLRAHDPLGSFLGTPAAAPADWDGAAQTIDSASPGTLPQLPGGFGVEREDEELGFLSPPTRPDSLGRLGHYEVLEVLGKGGFGIVFRAFDDTLQRVVAIKVLAPQLAATSPARKRFLREAKNSAQVRHEHVVHVYAVEEVPLPYLAMEFIPGETLQQRLDRVGPLEVLETIRIGRQIAEGLAAAHATDLIHRDIKPGNVLLEGAEHKVKITDFGLARAADDASLTQSGTIAGTPMYMAPEQALGNALDQRADLFSLGSVMYQMASGRPPFRAATTFAVLKRVVEETPRSIKEVIPETPQWLCDIIARLQAKKPDDRFQTAREVADVLADCEEQLKQNARVQDLSRIPRAASKSTSSGLRNWVIAASIVLLFAAIGVAQLEFAGVTKLFQRPATSNSINPNTSSASVVATPDADEWLQLFNRQNLTGWKTQPGAPGHWVVKDGILIGSRWRSVLFSERGGFTNFHLRAEAKINLGGDSGVFFRASPQQDADAAPPGGAGGYEVEIGKNLAYPRKTGSVTVPQENGPPLTLGLTTDDSLTRPDEWFTLELIAQENHFITKVNGKVTANCSDSLSRASSGHIAIQVWNPNTIVQFRKIEIKELKPESSLTPPTRQFASDEWIDVIPLIDPQLDKWDNLFTGKNEWRIEKGELLTPTSDSKPSKLLLPLDSAWQSFECDVEFTRRSGPGGFNVNMPTSLGDCPVVLGPVTTPGVYLGRKNGGVLLSEKLDLQPGARTRLRIEVRRTERTDHISVWVNDATAGEWEGDRTRIGTTFNEGYPAARRMSLWMHPGPTDIVFHRIAVRMLDGGTAESLRAAPSSASSQPDQLVPTFTRDRN